MITQEQLKELFEYRDGGLYWKVDRSANIKAGDRFGHKYHAGYRIGGIFNKVYREHRLIYLYHYGELPEILDHINRIRDDNRIENLRPATTSQNAMNRKHQINNTSGHRGVTWYKNSSKWQVTLKLNGKKTHIGYYDDFELACLVSDEARAKYFGEFA